VTSKVKKKSAMEKATSNKKGTEITTDQPL